MHPYQYYHHHGHWHHFHRRGPRRFIWFLVGAGVATWWIKHKEEQRQLGYGGGGSWGAWGHCQQRQAIQPAPQSPDQAQAAPYQQPQQSHQDLWTWRREQWMNSQQRQQQAVPQASPAEAASPAVVPVTSVVLTEEKAPRQPPPTPQEVNMGQQAGDRLVELSEATLDTVLNTVEVLKAKLAEHRAEREKSRGDGKSDSPPRLV